jgi:multicomponent Na+:H+ antiporter subunit F
MSLILAACIAMLAVAAVLLVIRIALGPSMLDRVIALDALVAVLVAGLALEAAANRHTTTVPILVVLSLVGFVGTVSMARFVSPATDGGRHDQETEQA